MCLISDLFTLGYNSEHLTNIGKDENPKGSNLLTIKYR